MVPDAWTERLSDYLDGDLEAAERAALERHVQGCANCTAALSDLRWVVARAQAVTDRPPAHDLWPDIARRIEAVEVDEHANHTGEGREAARSGSIPSRPFRTRAVALAASIVILLTIGVTVAPARDWIVDRLAEIVPLPGGWLAAGVGSATSSSRPAGPTDGPAVGDPQRGIASSPSMHAPAEQRVVERRAGAEVVHIIPAGTELILEFDRHQIYGSLEVRVQNVTRASLWIAEGGAAGSVHATPRGFRVRNSDDSATDYLVTVPTNLRSVRVRIGNPHDEYIIRDLYQPLRWVFGLQKFDS